MITLYYRADPNEVLGVFPEYPFDAEAMYGHMINMGKSLATMQAALDGARKGDENSCNAYVGAYDVILTAGTFYEDVPGDWGDIDLRYMVSFIYSLDRTRPAYLSCKESGRVDDFNYSLAWRTIDQVWTVLNPAIDAAASKLGKDSE